MYVYMYAGLHHTIPHHTWSRAALTGEAMLVVVSLLAASSSLPELLWVPDMIAVAWGGKGGSNRAVCLGGVSLMVVVVMVRWGMELI